MMTSDDDPGSDPHPETAQNLAELGEDGLIERIRKAAEKADPRVLKGIGDDAAVVVPSEKSAVTTDLLIENVHFRLDLTIPRLLGKKALSVNLSDIAAMGGDPMFAFLGLAAPAGIETRVIDQIVEGFGEVAARHRVVLAGGDVCRAERLTLAITVIGGVDPPAPVYRQGARPGDAVFVTGALGDSALGLMRLLEIEGPLTEEIIKNEKLYGPIMKHLDPEPRVELGKTLAGLATSMIDLSDGIMIDLPRLLVESGGLGAEIQTALIPLSDSMREYFNVDQPAGDALRLALSGGEDYELLFTASKKAEQRIVRIGTLSGIGITRIGEITERPQIALLDQTGERVPLPEPVFEHFSAKKGPGSE